MEKLRKFCNTCKEEKDIIEIEKDSQSETIKLSCGHKIIKVELIEKFTLSDEIMAKHFNSFHKLQSRYKTKTSGETKRPARDNFIIDRKRRKNIHQVWEQNKDGNWILIHNEQKPFRILKKNFKQYLWRQLLGCKKEGKLFKSLFRLRYNLI